MSRSEDKIPPKLFCDIDESAMSILLYARSKILMRKNLDAVIPVCVMTCVIFV